MEWLDAAVVVGGPAAVLIAADFAFEPVHEKNRQFHSLQLTVEEGKKGKKKSKDNAENAETQRTQRSAENGLPTRAR